MSKKKSALLFFYAPQNDEHRLLVQTLAEALNNEGYELHALSSGSEAWLASLELEAHLIPVPKIFGSALLFPIYFTLVAPFSLLLLAWSTRAKHLFVFTPRFSLLSILSLLFARLRPILVLEDVPWERIEHNQSGLILRSVQTLLSQFGVFLSRMVITSSNAAARSIRSAVPGAKIAALSFSVSKEARMRAKEEQGEELREIFDFPKNSFVIGLFDPLIEKRGVEMLLRSLSATEDRHICALLFSEGPQRRAVESIAVSLGLDERFYFSETISQSLELASQCDLFLISPSYTSVSPWIFELLPSRALLFAPDYPCFRELLSNEEFLYPKENVDVLSRMISSAKSSKKEQLRAKKQLRVEQFCFSYPEMLSKVLAGEEIKTS